jgi:predicted secreted hydrolase
MRRLLRIWLLLSLLGGGLLLSAGWALTRPPQPARLRATLSVAEELRGDSAEGYARATEPRPFTFPADHGPHPEFRTEWWYYTGNLETPDGRHFGFELTFFRIALAPDLPPRQSSWATNQMYMAHFAVTDVAGSRFHAFERFSRGALGLAGAQAQPFRVWLEDWSVEAQEDDVLPMRLRAAQGDVAIDLSLDSTAPPVLHGNDGLSQKGPELGNASYYYSFTRMSATGTVRIGEQRFAVQGLAWMDREWSTSALGPDQAGWDWFALQFADGQDLMFYRLRKQDGSTDPFSAGTLVRGDGSLRRLSSADVEIEPLGYWQSPRSGARYPVRWRLRVPSEGLEVEITPYLPDQELDLTVRYWEGAVRVQGRSNDGRPVSGSGYVELTGYGDTALRGT